MISSDYQRIETAIHYIGDHFRSQPRLEEVAEAVHMSPFHFQRLFKRWAGISPKRFLQYLTVEFAKTLLEESRNLLDVSYEAGLSGPGRLHDLFVALEAVTPGEFKQRGKGLAIEYGFADSPFGDCLIATTHRGVCHLSFVRQSDYGARIEKLQRNWPEANLRRNDEVVKPLAEEVFGTAARGQRREMRLYVRGTNFQIRVWNALLRIPPGHLCSYESVARSIRRPEAVRAVAGAIGSNPVSYLIPCHRVVRKMGETGGYDGGLERKRALIGWEAAQRFGESGLS